MIDSINPRESNGTTNVFSAVVIQRVAERLTFGNSRCQSSAISFLFLLISEVLMARRA